jgi:hypothetical protein
LGKNFKKGILWRIEGLKPFSLCVIDLKKGIKGTAIIFLHLCWSSFLPAVKWRESKKRG